MWYFQVLVNEASRDEGDGAPKARDASVQAARHYLDQTLREEVAVKCISGDGAEELGR